MIADGDEFTDEPESRNLNDLFDHATLDCVVLMISTKELGRCSL
jgi:hypothetical protein